jgi:hypothetical protein
MSDQRNQQKQQGGQDKQQGGGGQKPVQREPIQKPGSSPRVKRKKAAWAAAAGPRLSEFLVQPR